VKSQFKADVEARLSHVTSPTEKVSGGRSDAVNRLVYMVSKRNDSTPRTSPVLKKAKDPVPKRWESSQLSRGLDHVFRVENF
jgi:hypothetical protein